MGKRLIDILPKISQYESIAYSAEYCCPDCGKSGIGKRGNCKCNLVGWCETPSGYMVVCECPVCGSKFRFHPHLMRFDKDDFNMKLECEYIGEECFSLVANSKEWEDALEQINMEE